MKAYNNGGFNNSLDAPMDYELEEEIKDVYQESKKGPELQFIP